MSTPNNNGSAAKSEGSEAQNKRLNDLRELIATRRKDLLQLRIEGYNQPFIIDDSKPVSTQSKSNLAYDDLVIASHKTIVQLAVEFDSLDNFIDTIIQITDEKVTELERTIAENSQFRPEVGCLDNANKQQNASDSGAGGEKKGSKGKAKGSGFDLD